MFIFIRRALLFLLFCGNFSTVSATVLQKALSTLMFLGVVCTQGANTTAFVDPNSTLSPTLSPTGALTGVASVPTGPPSEQVEYEIVRLITPEPGTLLRVTSSKSKSKSFSDSFTELFTDERKREAAIPSLVGIVSFFAIIGCFLVRIWNERKKRKQKAEKDLRAEKDPLKSSTSEVVVYKRNKNGSIYV